MAHVPDNLVLNTITSRQARGVVYVGLAFLAHCLIWAAIPASYALALSATLVVVERLAGELADTILGAVAARDEVAPKLIDARPGADFRDELKFELFGPSAAIALAVLAAVAGLLLKPWLAPGLQWLGA